LRFQTARRGLSSAPSAAQQERFAADDAPSAKDVQQLQSQFQSNPGAAKVSFSAQGQLTSGLRSSVRIRDKFSVDFDEPRGLGGSDTAPNPVEGVLAALATCQEITYKAFARANGLQLDGLQSSFLGAIDLRGFFAVGEVPPRAGFRAIEGRVVAEGLGAQELEGLKAAVDAHCPVLDSLVRPVEVHLALKCIQVPSGLGAEEDAPSAVQIGALQSKFAGDKAAAQASFQVDSSLARGLRSSASMRGGKFTISADEPKMLGGTDTAPNPVELLLASLASCQEITYKAYARAMGLELTRVSCTVKGLVDLRGFFAVASYEEARPGFYKIEGEVTVESTASEAELHKLKQVVDAHCPVLDMLRNAVPTAVVTELKKA
jgi:uncharacterized OsmC-like protein